jgi:biotin operon repressor
VSKHNEVSPAEYEPFKEKYSFVSLQVKLGMTRRQVEMAMQAIGNTGAKVKNTHERIQKTNTILAQLAHN